MSSDTSSSFNHSFQGWSVWIEPCEQDCEDIVKEINFLAAKCGGSECGMHPFVPHCTLHLICPPITGANERETMFFVSQQEEGEELLNKCLEKFWNACNRKAVNGDQEDTNETTTTNEQQHELQLIPTSFYYFPYPKHADDGKGFGCVISLILLEKTFLLERLHEAVAATFPPDERQGNFVPHVSLVYAPENKAEWLQDYTNEMQQGRKDLLRPLRARYLSLWSTQGQVKDWHRIARVEI